MAQALWDEESEEEVGGESGTSEDEAIEQSDHDTESEEELNDTDEGQENSDQELIYSDVDEVNENSETSEDDSEEYFVARDKKERMVWKKSPIVSKFSKTDKKKYYKIISWA